MMVIFTTDVVPFEWQIPGWNWALIIPLSLVVGCHILVPVRLAFFFGSEKCIYSVFTFCFADRPEPVVDDFLVLRCRLHAWALVWGICLPIQIFSLCSTFSTAVALCTNGHLWTWTFVLTGPRSLLAHTHTQPIHSSHTITSSNLIYRALSCLYQIFLCMRTPFPYCFPISIFLLGWGILDLVNSCHWGRCSRLLISPPLTPNLNSWPPFIRG